MLSPLRSEKIKLGNVIFLYAFDYKTKEGIVRHYRFPDKKSAMSTYDKLKRL